MCLDSKKSLVIQQTMRERNTSRVPVTGGLKVGDGGRKDGGVGGEGFEEEIVKESGEECGGAKLVSQME